MQKVINETYENNKILFPNYEVFKDLPISFEQEKVKNL